MLGTRALGFTTLTRVLGFTTPKTLTTLTTVIEGGGVWGGRSRFQKSVDSGKGMLGLPGLVVMFGFRLPGLVVMFGFRLPGLV
eukprot:1187741-Prorocentrum_minimum.AAC.2